MAMKQTFAAEAGTKVPTPSVGVIEEREVATESEKDEYIIIHNNVPSSGDGPQNDGPENKEENALTLEILELIIQKQAD